MNTPEADSTLVPQRINRRNLVILSRFFLALILLVVLYSILFHVFMAREGREFSWFTGVYWTLTVMSTLGFGDITFTSDLGRAFSVFVLVSGSIFMMVLLPFSFIQFFWVPWTEAQSAAQAPRRLAERLSGHVLLTNIDDVTHSLISRLDQHHTPHLVLVTDPEEALRLQDQGHRTLVGHLDDPEFYRQARVAQAAFVVATGEDTANTSVAHTIREIESEVPIVATARDPASVDILELAGCTQVIELAEMLGQSLARRVSGGDAAAHEIGCFDELVVAEATPTDDMIGCTLEEIGLRRRLGTTVIGVWDRGRFETALPSTKVGDHTVLIIAGAREHITRFNEEYTAACRSDGPVVIIGGGGVGRGVRREVMARGLDYRVIEMNPDVVPDDDDHYVSGSAARLEILKEAGIDESPAVVITTRDDAMNLYLSIYCRRLRPDVQIVARANAERNIDTLYRAGADFVMSYASMGASAIINLLRRGDALMVDAGLDVFRTPMPQSLVGSTIAASEIRRATGCTVVALERDGETAVNPDPYELLAADAEIILIGTSAGEKRFHETFGDH